jgi:hypothetical protein
MRRFIAVAFVAMSAMSVLGCGADALGPVTTVDGEWAGIQNGYSLSLTLTQTPAGEVSGTALVAGTSGVTDAAVSGTFTFPNLILTITPPSFEPVIYTGTMSQASAKIDGKLNGSGFSNLVINISKRR